MENSVALYRMRRKKCIKLFFLHAPGIDIFSRLDTVNRKKRLTLVLERRSNRSLKQTIECQQILGCGPRAATLIQLQEIAIRPSSLGVPLLFVELLKDLSHLDQFSHRCLFSGAQMRNIGSEPNRLRLFD